MTKPIQHGEWELVHTDGTPVMIGAREKDFRGDHDIIVGGSPPHREGVSGYAHTKAGSSLYVTVFGLQWRKIVKACPGIEIMPGEFSGCSGTGGDCPVCGK